MKSTELLYSKSLIDKSGEQLKQKGAQDIELEEAWEALSNWRAYHAMPLDTFAKVLKTRVKKASNSGNFIVAQRLKRAPSILLKLQTHKTMRLSAMQDIGGLRAILDTVDEVYNLLDLYKGSKSKHSLFSLDDYIQEPKADGYRGIHLVYKLSKAPSLFLEIQMRSHLQHIWATGVEVFGTLKSSSFKSGYGDQKWLEFFSVLSAVFSLKEKVAVVEKYSHFSKAQLLEKAGKMIKDLQVIEQLSIYTALYKISSGGSARGRKGNYSLILLDSINNTIKVTTYGAGQIDEATSAYLNLEKKYFKNDNVNIVLVNSGDIKKLELSYPNYFMDTKILVRNLSLIVMEGYL